METPQIGPIWRDVSGQDTSVLRRGGVGGEGNNSGDVRTILRLARIGLFLQ